MILDSSLRSATFRMTECQHYLVTGQGFEEKRLISEVVTVERLITSRIGFNAD